MTNENQSRQKEEKQKQKRLMRESRKRARQAEKESKVKQEADKTAEDNVNGAPCPRQAPEAREEKKENATVENSAPMTSETEQKRNTPKAVKSAENKNPVQEENEQKKKPAHKNYHVSLREDGKWQVKFAKGEKALKLFDTQAEAIAFAKEKAKNQDGNITIHKTDGKIRKQNYNKNN